MNFAELMDSWLTEKIARMGKLELRVAELEERAATLDSVREIVNEVVAAALDEIPSHGSLTESRVKDIVQNELCDTDWSNMIGEEVNAMIDDKLCDFDAVIKDKNDDELSDL